MKKILMTTAALLLTGSAMAVPSIVFEKVIDVGGTIISPHGINAIGGDIYIAGFANRDIGKIAAAETATPVISELVPDNIGGLTWPASRGPQAIEVKGGNLFIIGDNGTNGYGFEFTTAGAQVGANIEYTGMRVCSGAIWGTDPDLVAGRSNSGTVIDLPLSTAAAAETTGPAPAAGFASPLRDFTVVGNDFFCITAPIAAGTSPAGQYNISRYQGGTAGDLTGYTQDQFTIMGPFTVTVNHLGISQFTDTGDSNKVYIVAVDLGASPAPAIKLYDAATPDLSLPAAPVVTFTDAELTTGVRGLEVVTLGGNQYIALTRVTGTPANSVVLYRINPTAAAVEDWARY